MGEKKINSRRHLKIRNPAKANKTKNEFYVGGEIPEGAIDALEDLSTLMKGLRFPSEPSAARLYREMDEIYDDPPE